VQKITLLKRHLLGENSPNNIKEEEGCNTPSDEYNGKAFLLFNSKPNPQPDENESK